MERLGSKSNSLGVLLVSLSLSDWINHFFVAEAFDVVACLSCILMGICKQKASLRFISVTFDFWYSHQPFLVFYNNQTSWKATDSWENWHIRQRVHEWEIYDDESTIFIEKFTCLLNERVRMNVNELIVFAQLNYKIIISSLNFPTCTV